MRLPLAGVLIALAAIAACSGEKAASTSGTSGAAAQAASVPDLSGVWLGTQLDSLSPSDPAADKKLGTEEDIPYSQWALDRLKGFKPAKGPDGTFDDTNDPSLRYADPNGYPRSSIHPLRFKIVQTSDFVYQLWEYNQTWRQIALNKPHSQNPQVSWLGESVGKYEGDALVVDVVALKDATWLDPVGHPHSEDMHIVERIHLTDPDTLIFEMTFEDKTAYTKPWSTKVPFKRAKNGVMTENIYTISDELRFRERLLGEKPGVAIRR